MKTISPKIIYLSLAVLFLMLMTLANQLLDHYRIDMTENNAYTLSDSTYTILGKIDQPINLYLFFSQEASKNQQFLRKYHNRVKEMLEEFARYAEGKLKVQFIDPEPFSEQEDWAASLGLQNIPVQGGAGEPFYFGLAGTNAVGGVETIPFLNIQRETFLEYDIDKLIYSLLNSKKPVLGLMSSLPMHPAGVNLPGLENSGKGWAITKMLEQQFEVKLVFNDATEIDSDVDVLMVVHPKGFEDSALYAIDQYVVKGGKAIFFVDTFAEVEQVPIPKDVPLAAEVHKYKSSSLNDIFEKWGFTVDKKSIVTDIKYALHTVAPGQAAQRNIAMLGYRDDSIDRKDVTTAKLERVNFGAASHIAVLQEDKIEMTPLIWSSAQSYLIPSDYMRFLGFPSVLLEKYKPSGKNYPIVARLKGKLSSSYDKPPEIKSDDEDNGSGESTPKEPINYPPHKSQSDKEVSMVVVADVDVLSDRLWVQVRKILNQEFHQPIANNHDLVINMIDNLTGDEALIGIRGRAVFNRPFTKVNEIQELADQKYRATEEALQRKLRETEQRLQQLQNQRVDNKSTMLTPEQQAEVTKIRTQINQTRRELREVKHKLAKDIDTLSDYLKIANIGLMPFLLTLVTAGFVWLRHRRNKPRE